jgi:hypothetical protein
MKGCESIVVHEMMEWYMATRIPQARTPSLLLETSPADLAGSAAIGTGLFVGAGGELATGGPLGILLGYTIMVSSI